MVIADTHIAFQSNEIYAFCTYVRRCVLDFYRSYHCKLYLLRVFYVCMNSVCICDSFCVLFFSLFNAMRSVSFFCYGLFFTLLFYRLLLSITISIELSMRTFSLWLWLYLLILNSPREKNVFQYVWH